MYRGMVEKDAAILRSVLAPEFVLVHMTGMRQTLEVFVSAVLNGTLNYRSAHHQKIDAKINADEGELIGQSVVFSAVFGGDWHTWHLQLSCRLVKRDNKWFISEATASTY